MNAACHHLPHGLRLLAPVAALLLIGLALTSAAAPVGASGARPQDDPALARGLELYQRYCATCHGPEGRGDGDAAYLLSPKPRNFASARFRLVSTSNGQPSDEDLLQMLRRGMPGSAMPPWDFLAEAELRALVAAVRELAAQGLAADFLAEAAAADEELSAAEARELAAERLAPGAPLALPPAPPADTGTLQHGRELYLRNCADCHGADGRGLGVKEQWNEDGTPTRPRDFTAGVLKGSSSHEELVRRMLLGMPGSPMPAGTFEHPADAAAITTFVRSLIPPGAEERNVQARRLLHAPRARGPLPRSPEDPAWREAPSTYLALMPLWWRDQRAEGVTVVALHDGSELAMRLSWQDPAPDDELLTQQGFSDAVAVQLSTEADPPLFTMGSTGRPVDLWLWKAAWERERDGARGLEDIYPNIATDLYPHLDPDHAALYRTARALGNFQAQPGQAAAAENLAAQGFGTLESPGAVQQNVAARGQWHDGAWQAVFVRRLAAGPEQDVVLAPGSISHVAFAVWDGAAGDRNGQKSATVWHLLELQP